MRYSNKELELKVLKRKARMELRDNTPIIILGFVFGLYIGYIIVTKYL